MRKRISSIAFFILFFLVGLIIIHFSGANLNQIQEKFELSSNQFRLQRKFERGKKAEYLKNNERQLGSKSEPSNMGFMRLGPQDVKFKGIWPYGPCYASDLDSTRNFALIGNGEAMEVLDISDSSSPSKIGEVAFQFKPQDIVISGNYGYVLSSVAMFVVDISNLSNPDWVGTASVPGAGISLAVSGGYAYVIADDEGLRIIDIADPANPTETGFYDPDDFNADDAVIWGNYALIIGFYFTDSSYQLRIVDITTPSSPSLVGTYVGESGWEFERVDVSTSGYAYISQFNYMSDTGELAIIDVATDSANPTKIGGYTESGTRFYDVAFSGEYAYLIGVEGEIPSEVAKLKIINVSNPSATFWVSECEVYKYFPDEYDLKVSGSYIGICMINHGFGLYDVSDPSSPQHASSYDTLSPGKDVAVSGDFAYVASNLDGLRVIDISIPSSPIEVGFEDFGLAYDVFISGNYAYVLDSMDLIIIDISSPSAPFKVEDIDIPGSPEDVVVSENYAYVCGYERVPPDYDHYARLSVIDVSDPSDPALIGSYACSIKSSFIGIDFAGKYVYLAFDDETPGNPGTGLKILDVSDPENPTEVGTYTTSEFGITKSIKVRGNYAYLAGDELRIIDVSNPQSPTEISSYDSLFSIHGQLDISGSYAYLSYPASSYGEPGLEVVDITNPYLPTGGILYQYDLEGGVAVRGNYIFLPGSLLILQNSTVPEVSITAPSEWATVNGSVSIEAHASYYAGIDRVKFYIDDSFKGEDTSSPYSYAWDTASEAEGPHKLRAEAYNNVGKSSDAEIEVTVRNFWNLTISSTSGGTTDPVPGTYSYDPGTQVAITFIPDSNYRFIGWTGDVPSGHENDNPVTITMDSDTSLTANFIRQYTLTVAAGTGGTTDPSPGSYTHDLETPVSVRAIPNSGYQFSSWSGDATGSSNPINLIMDSDKSITANFTATSTDGGGDGTDGPGGGCFIATAAYGSSLHPHIKILRDFRDKYLVSSKLGREFVDLYYTYSPFAANLIKRHKALQIAVQINLNAAVVFSYLMVYFGPLITGVIIFLILVLPVFYVRFTRRN